MKSFTSPWQSLLFLRTVQLVRHLLRPLGDLENRYIATLVERQNQRVRQHFQLRPVTSALLIMPRCVKLTGCRAQVQTSLDECLNCARCPLGEVARVCAEFELTAIVAFRSHIAFDIARRRQPDLIIASACHDRLVKALRSVPDIPALLAPLTGMQSQCLNATVDPHWLRAQLTLVKGLAPAAMSHPVDNCPPVLSLGDKP